ncbi:calcium/calmodulin-dependent protein kinase IV [Ectocarpus siliculosus]|uniref:Calcium/calmodulin-dependent protein kinase IV n=1 Tax=Ectocarpus siliculosus TaxID=2880 RepID=D8LEH8_ECTSI|nr:calcium/calmodulin-dependent protein kinase IV [Ectocarpus siliculosus]|eukprot:CBN80221.1 calcium/calmodulin-dependent protein kinase IV [Ectocarpus siliculosus]
MDPHHYFLLRFLVFTASIFLLLFLPHSLEPLKTFVVLILHCCCCFHADPSRNLTQPNSDALLSWRPGAFGVVCAGVHKVTGEVVAVKQIPRRLMSTPRLQAEVDMLRMAGQHKNVVGFRDLFSDDNFYYIVMEFATGGELFDRLVTKGAHSEHDAASLLREVVDAVAYLHGHSIIHFDIKPENILLHDADTDDIDVRLVDFGSAFVVGATGESGPKNDSGTIAYSAPEVLRGQSVSTAADMWSLGVVLYILLSGFHPFDLEGGANDADVRRKVLARELTFESAHWSGKEGAVDLINQLLDSDPKRRPTAEAVLAHPWMQKTANLSRRPMVHAAENLRGFHRGRMQLKACLLAVMSGLASPETYGHDPKSTVGSRTGALKWMDQDRRGRKKGYLSAADLDKALKMLGENLNDREILRMMQASTGHPGTEHAPRVMYEDFMKLVPPLCPSQVFKGGATIYTEGEIDRNFYLINQGEVLLEVEGVSAKKRGRLWGRSTAQSERDGEDFVVNLETLKRGSSFGEAELLAAAEAEEGLAAAAAALKHRQNSQKTERLKSMGRATAAKQQQQQPKEPAGMLVSAAGVSSEGVKPTAIAVEKSLPARKRTPGEEYGRGPARGGGVARAVRAVCVSEEDCEVMAVPRHLFANLLDELGGVRRKLEGQAKARAARGLNRLIEENTLPGSREKLVPASTDVWPPPTPKGGGGRDLDAPDMSGISGSSGMGETRRVSRRDAPTVLLFREGSAAVTLSDGTRMKVGAGEVLVCGVPRRGIPRITKVTSDTKAKVVEVPLESFRKGGLFSSPAALDAFLRVLSVGFHDVSE